MVHFLLYNFIPLNSILARIEFNYYCQLLNFTTYVVYYPRSKPLKLMFLY